MIQIPRSVFEIFLIYSEPYHQPKSNGSEKLKTLHLHPMTSKSDIRAGW